MVNGAGVGANAHGPDQGSRGGKGGTRAKYPDDGKNGTSAKHAEKERARADRAAETLLRVAHAKHEGLSSLADGKANMLLTISVAIAGVSATQVFDPQLQLTAVTLIVSNLLTAALAVYATMPTLPSRRNADAADPEFNLVFFGDFANLTRDAFEREMGETLRDRDAVHRALVRDLHSLGTVLSRKKYRYLSYCYRVFLAGLVLSALVLLGTIAAPGA